MAYQIRREGWNKTTRKRDMVPINQIVLDGAFADGLVVGRDETELQAMVDKLKEQNNADYDFVEVETPAVKPAPE